MAELPQELPSHWEIPGSLKNLGSIFCRGKHQTPICSKPQNSKYDKANPSPPKIMTSKTLGVTDGSKSSQFFDKTEVLGTI